jgi:hypothetical protein
MNPNYWKSIQKGVICGHLINAYYACNLKLKMSLLKNGLQIGKLILGVTKFTLETKVIWRSLKLEYVGGFVGLFVKKNGELKTLTFETLVDHNN